MAEAAEQLHTVELLRREINERSSYGPDSKPVKKMAEAHQQGIPLAWYELMQGMVDYGRNGRVPPRIHFTLKDATDIVFDGTNMPNTADVQQISFENYGPGMSPEDTVISMHDSDDQDSLGDHGHGTTVALAYLNLNNLGPHITIESNHDGRNWIAEAVLVPTTTGKTSTLNVRGEWLETCAPDDQKTRFKLAFVPHELIESMRSIPDMFLFANPNYPGAIIVPPTREAQERGLSFLRIDNGRIACLRGCVQELPSYNFIFVDGLRVNFSYFGQQTVLPWDIQGLKSARENRFRTSRSTDSTRVDGYPQYVIAEAVAALDNEQLLEKIIAAAVENPSVDFLELAASGNVFTAAAKAAIQNVWRLKHENALIALEEVPPEETEGRKVIAVSAKLYEFLKAAGIKTILQEMGAIQMTRFRGIGKMSLPYAAEPDALDRVISRLPYIGAVVDLVMLDGVQHLRIKLPGAITTQEDLLGTTEHDSGKTLRMLASIASVQGISLKTFSITGETHNKLRVDTTRRRDGSFEHNVTVEEYRLGHLEEFLGYETGATYVLLSGMEIDTLENPTRLQILLEKFLESLSKFQEVVKSATQIRRRGARRTNADRANNRVAFVSIDDTPANDDALRSFISIEDGFDRESIVRPGEYPLRAGTRLQIQNRKLTWTSECGWCEMEVPRRRCRSDIALVERNVIGERRLPVKRGYKVGGYKVEPETADISFFMDIKNGIWRVAGDADVLEVYVVKDKGAPNFKRRPMSEELEDPFYGAEHLLDTNWRDLLRNVRSNKQLSKKGIAGILAQAWHDRFSIGDSEEIAADSKSEHAARLVNEQRGESASYATGLAMLLRAAGVPSKVMFGYRIDEDFKYRHHMWTEYNDGETWHALASTEGIQIAAEDIPLIVDNEVRKREPRIIDNPRVRFRERGQNPRLGTPRSISRATRAMMVACLLALGGSTILPEEGCGDFADDQTMTETQKKERLWEILRGQDGQTPEETSADVIKQVCEVVCE